MSQEGPKILQDSLFEEEGTRVKGVFKIAAANLSLFFPPATVFLAAVGSSILMPYGLGMWCTGKAISWFTKKHGDASRELMAEGKDVMWTGAMLCVPYVGPTLLMADGAVNVTTGKNYGADGYLATFENFKIAVNDTKEYLGQKIDGLKKTLGLSKGGNDKTAESSKATKPSQEKAVTPDENYLQPSLSNNFSKNSAKKKPPESTEEQNIQEAQNRAKGIPTKDMKLGGGTYATPPQSNTGKTNVLI